MVALAGKLMSTEKEQYEQWYANKKAKEKADYEQWYAQKQQAGVAQSVGVGLAGRGMPMIQEMPQVGPENTFLSSEAGQSLIERGITAPESLTSDEQRQFKAVRENFPEVDAIASQYDQQRAEQEQAQPSGDVDPGFAGGFTDVLAESTKPIIDHFRKRAQTTPHSVTRDLTEKPMDADEFAASRAFKAGNPIQQGIWTVEHTVNDALAGTLEFATQTLDQVVNSEKYGKTHGEAVKELAEGTVKMITDVPDQVAAMAEQMLGKSNGITKIIELAQAPATLASEGKIDRTEIRKQVLAELESNPSALLFGAMMAAGAVKGGVKIGERLAKTSEGLKAVKAGAEKAGTITPEEAATIDRVVEMGESDISGKVKLEPEKKATDVTPAPERKASAEPITQAERDAAIEVAKRVRPEVESYQSQIEGMEKTLETVQNKRDRVHLEPILKNWRKKLAENEKVLAEAEATMKRPLLDNKTGQSVVESPKMETKPAEVPPEIQGPDLKPSTTDLKTESFVPETIKTGNDMADAGRNLAHTKKAIQVAEQALDLKTITEEQRAQAQSDLTTLQQRLAEQQAEYDRMTNPGAAETTLSIQPEEMAGGIGMVGKGPSPIREAKKTLAEYGVDPAAPGGVAAGIKRQLAMWLGKYSERLAAGFEEVGAGKAQGTDAYHILRESGEEINLLRRVSRENAIQQFGDLLLKEVERQTRKPEWSDKDYAFIQETTARQIRSAMKKRDLPLLRTIGEQLDAKMFQATKGIKSVAPDGTIEFGTMQRAGVYGEGETVPKGLVKGEELIEGEFKGKTQYYREITEKQAREAFGALSPDTQAYVKDYVRRMQDLSTSAGIPQRVEGYVHSFADPKKSGTRFTGLWNRLKQRVAPERRYRTGILAEEGREIQSLVMSEEKTAVDLGSEAIHNEAAAKLIGVAARILKKGEAVPPGWEPVKWTEGAQEFGRILDLSESLLKERGYEVDLADVRQAGAILAGKRVVVPRIIAEDLGGILKYKPGQTTVTPTTLALMSMGDAAAGWAVNNVVATMLLRPKTTGINFLGGEIQFSTKVLQDFYEGLFTRDMTKVKQDMASYARSLTRESREAIPNEWLGETFFSQFEQKGAMPGYNEILSGFRAVEYLQKRRTFDAVIHSEAKRIAGGDAVVEAAILKDPPQEVLREAYTQMDRVNFDYDNLPAFIRTMKRSQIGRAIMPFPSYMYHGTRLTLSLLNPNKANVLGKGLSAAERAQRAAHIARAATLGTVGYLLTPDLQDKNDDLKNDVYGRTPVGEIDGKRVWVDVTQLPIVREAALARRLYAGDFDYVAKYADAMYGFGPAIQAMDIVRDVRDQYERDMPTAARVGRFVSQFQPYAPILQYIRRKTDLVKRRSYDMKSGFAENFFYGYAAENPALSEFVDAKVDPKTKQPLKYNGVEVDVAFWTPFNVKLRDDDQYRAFLQGQLIALVEKIVDPDISAKTKLQARERIEKIQQKIADIPGDDK